MTGRIPFGLLTLLTVLACAPIQAQGPMQAPPGYGPEFTGPPSQKAVTGYYYGFPMYQRTPVDCPPGIDPQTIYKQLPDDLGIIDHDTPFGQFLQDTFRHGFFRAEYLNWAVSGPGSQLLGEQTLSGVPNNVPYGAGSPNILLGPDIQFVQTVNGVSGAAQSPTTNGFSINGMSGFRGTWGVPLPAGQAEFSALVFGTRNANFQTADVNVPGSLIQPQIIGNPAVIAGGDVGSNGQFATNGQAATFISQAAKLDGLPSDTTFINYDVSYHAQLSTSLWGTEGNYVLPSANPNSPFQIVPTVGFRYLNLRDKLLQNGQYNESNPIDPTINTIVTRAINSYASNNIYGPQASLRSEFTYANVMIGFEPKVMLGLNTWQMNLDNTHVFSSTDPGQNLVSRNTTFTPLVDLKGYANVALTKYISLYTSYNYIWVGQVVRSYNNIQYNQNSQTTNADFSLLRNYTATMIQGWTVGFEIRY